MMIQRRTALGLAAGALGGMRIRPASADSSSTLDSIKQSKKLRVGVATAEPWFSKDPMSGGWDGVGVRMGKELATALGVEMVPVETTWANAIAALQANQIDIMFFLDPTEERRKAIDFPAAPLCYYAMGALTRADDPLKAWSDLDKSSVRLGVTLGTSVDRLLTEKLKATSISRFSNNDEAIAAFAARRVDVVAQFHPALILQYARLRVGKVVLPTPVDPVAGGAGVRKEENPAFRDLVNDRFAADYKAGKPQAFFAEYLKSKNVDPASVPGLIRENWT